MQKYLPVIFVLLLKAFGGYSQCPVGFNVPDTACANVPFNIGYTSPGGQNYHWDFCPGDLDTIPSGYTVPNPGGFYGAASVKVIYDNGNYYAFVAVVNLGVIVRVDYGNSIDNTPSGTFNYSSNFQSPFGIDVYKDGINWYVFATDQDPGASGNKMVRFDLGSNISANTYTATTFTDPGLSTPRGIKIVKDNNLFYIITGSVTNTLLCKWEFGSSLGNAVSNITYYNILPNTNASSIDIVYDCVSGKYAGFVSQEDVHKIAVVDFGNTMSGAPVFLHLLSVFSTPRGINVVLDGKKWHVWTCANQNSLIQQLILGEDIFNSSAPIGFQAPVATMNNPSGFDLFRDNDTSVWRGFITDYNPPNFIITKWESACNCSQGVSDIAAPQNISYSQSGMQYMNFNLDSNDVTTYYADSIYIGVAPDALFTSDSACVGQPVAFTNLTTISQGTIVNQTWVFGDASPLDTSLNPVHTYASSGTYTVILTVLGSSGCAGTYSVNLTVHDLPVADFTFPNNQCANTPVQFTDISSAPSGESITGWEWNFGDSSPVEIIQNPVHAFDSAATYTVQLIAYASSGCNDTVTHNITIKANPVAGFTVSNTCVGDITQFTNTTDSVGLAGVTYNWDFGDLGTSILASPTHTFAGGPANYTVQLTATGNGCSDILSIDIHISSKANPGFTNSPDTACIGNSIQFTDNSTIAAGDSIVGWHWDFGDSTFATGDTVTHTYSTFGTFNVTLTVTSETACDTSITKTITVLESPTASFNFTNVCFGFQTNFANTSTTPAGSTIDSICWNFGDGNIDCSGLSSIQNMYAAAGFYNVILTVVNNFGCSDTNLQVVQVYEKPFATFTTSLACSGDTIHFTNGSFVQNDSLISYQWDFNDGSLLNFQQHPDHLFDSAGTYAVTLTVYSSHGCEKDTTINVVVMQSPQFNFTDSLLCFGNTTQFTYIPLQNPDPGLNWLWNFGDGNTSSQVNPSHQFLTSGTHTVSLSVTGFNTCQGIVINTLTIHENPVADFISNLYSCVGSAAAFTDNSTIPSPDFITQWAWNFGDGSPLDNNQNTSHIYTTVSLDTVILTVTSNAGCTDSTTKYMDVQPLPVVSFTPDHTFGSPPFTVQFINTTTGALTYYWTFGDGSSLYATSPVHTYNDTGFYHVTMVATSAYGCKDSTDGDVIVLIPFLDLGIKNIHATPQNDLLAISADLVNYGNITIHNFQISTHTETGSAINEQWTSVLGLKAGQIMTYNFIARYEIDSAFDLPAYFCVDISEINGGKDSVESNNHKCSAIETVFEIFDIHPNPAGSQITFGINVPEDGEVTVSYYDALGQIVKKEMIIPVTKGHNEIIDSVRNFANGFYVCVVKYGDQVLSKKLMKSK